MSKTRALTTTQYGLPADVKGLAQFASRGGDDDVGDRLRANGKDGRIYIGSQGSTMESGARLAIFVNHLMEGFVHWDSGTLVDQKWLRVTAVADLDADLKALRSSMGHTNPDEWKEALPNGLPKDPIQAAVKFPVTDMATGRLYTYSVNSWNGVKAARQLARGCLVQAAAAPETTHGCLPIAILTVAKKTTPNGLIYWGAWEVDDWAPAGEVLHALGKSGQASQLGVSNEDAVNADLAEEPGVTTEDAKPAKKPKVRL